MGHAGTRKPFSQRRGYLDNVGGLLTLLQRDAASAHRARIVRMIHDIERLLEAYHSWLKERSVLRQVDQWVEITTPYVDRHNDYIQIYAKRANGGFVLTDDGYTIEDLEQGGCKLESRKRQDLLTMTLNGFGVQ